MGTESPKVGHSHGTDIKMPKKGTEIKTNTTD
jgi:hypothetical protein